MSQMAKVVPFDPAEAAAPLLDAGLSFDAELRELVMEIGKAERRSSDRTGAISFSRRAHAAASNHSG
jgi:hypothetical protein